MDLNPNISRRFSEKLLLANHRNPCNLLRRIRQ